MKKVLLTSLVMVFAMVFVSTAFASATLDEAKTFVDKAVAYYQKNGKEAALKEYNNPKGQFVKGELYVFAWDMNGTNIAHPMNPRQVGVNVVEVPDVDGKYFRRDGLEAVKKNGTATVDYKFKNPTTGKVEPKVTYLKKVGDIVVGCGAYK